MAWIREGECCRCGECCVGDPGVEDMVRPGPIDGYCPLYALLPDGKHGCSNREHSYYLGGCNVYPDDPRQIADKPSCSFTFRWQD